jgi:putative ABC transport system substrate-binding protein
MRRREFLTNVAAAVLAPATYGAAQEVGRVARVGRLSPLSEASEKPMADGLREGLHDLGWTEGKNLVLKMRFADGELDQLPALAEELVREKIDVLVTGSTPGALAAKRATGTIPIVFVTTGDPVQGGIVASLGQPGGNITGITALGVELNAKRLELLKEAFGMSRVAVLANPGSPYTQEFRSQRDSTARSLGMELPLVEVKGRGELAAAFDRIGSMEVGGILVLSDIVFVSNPWAIVELVARLRIPAIYPDRAFVDAGGLMFYGAALPVMYRHAAAYVDKILRGAQPSKLPVEQPTNFELVVNQVAAKALGLTLLPSLLGRADHIIE